MHGRSTMDWFGAGQHTMFIFEFIFRQYEFLKVANFVLQLFLFMLCSRQVGTRFLVLEQGATTAVKKDFITKKTKLNFSFTATCCLYRYLYSS